MTNTSSIITSTKIIAIIKRYPHCAKLLRLDNQIPPSYTTQSTPHYQSTNISQVHQKINDTMVHINTEYIKKTRHTNAINSALCLYILGTLDNIKTSTYKIIRIQTLSSKNNDDMD